MTWKQMMDSSHFGLEQISSAVSYLSSSKAIIILISFPACLCIPRTPGQCTPRNLIWSRRMPGKVLRFNLGCVEPTMALLCVVSSIDRHAMNYKGVFVLKRYFLIAHKILSWTWTTLTLIWFLCVNQKAGKYSRNAVALSNLNYSQHT